MIKNSAVPLSVDFKAYVIALDFAFKPISDFTYGFIHNMLYYLFTFCVVVFCFRIFDFRIVYSLLFFFSLHWTLKYRQNPSRIHIQSKCQKIHLFAFCFDAVSSHVFCVCVCCVVYAFATPTRCHTCIWLLAHRKYFANSKNDHICNIASFASILLFDLYSTTPNECNTKMNCYLCTYNDLLASNSRKKI